MSVNSMEVVIHADDFGRTHGVTDTILAAIDKGVVTSTSLLVNGTAFNYALAAWQERPGLAMALHFNLTEGRTTADPSTIPLLVDADGHFRHSPLSLALSYVVAGPTRRRQLKTQVRAEFAAQLRTYRAGVGETEPVRVDSHQHVHMLPWVLKLMVAELTTRKDVSVAHVRVVREPLYLDRWSWQWRELLVTVRGYMHVIVMGMWARRATRLLQQNYLASNRYCLGLFRSGAMTYETLASGLAATAGQGGQTEVIVHPGGAAPGEEAIWLDAEKNYTQWYYAPGRAAELVMLQTKETRELVKAYRAGTYVPTGLYPRLSANLGQVIRFLITGTSAAVVHLGVLWLATERLGIWYVFSSAIGFGCGFVVSFWLQKYWTFADTNAAATPRQLVAYFGLQLGGLTMNLVGIYLLVDWLGMWYLGSQFVLLVAVAVITFFVSKFHIFTSSRVS